MMNSQNWFNTLAESLRSENLEDAWQIHFPPINRNQTYSWTHQDNSKYGRFISVYRDERGMYERPITYLR